jgi:uncharacterized protein (DUF1501 family)
MSTWQTARVDPQQPRSLGWLGRAMDQVNRPADGSSQAMLIGDDSPPIAIRGRQAAWTSLANLDEMQLDDGAVLTLNNVPAVNNVLTVNNVPAVDNVPAANRRPPTAGEDLLSFVTRTAVDAQATADLIGSLDPTATRGDGYADTALAQRMRTIAGLIKADLGTRVYYAIQPGYDTHSDQLRWHARLLSDLSGSLKAFLDDLQESGLDDRVIVLCFSEFGRRVQENGSNGTDHGTAGPVLLAGKQVRAGLIGQTPSLTRLIDGDPEMQIDFRRIYASLLEDWLRLPSQSSLNGRFEKLSVVL